MSMLAERRRKQKWSLNPRGKDWSEDANKFGQKMLEKMGWQSGKGLGAKENGITEHIRISYKNDSKGMGYKESNDQWTEHEANFSALLGSLTGNENGSIEVKVSSLEKKSESSRARVHYHKFTRGKDLSRYSEKDLANIFGKRSLKDVKKEDIKKDSDPDSKEGVKGNKFLVNSGTMHDYFRKKLPNFGKTNGYVIGNNGVLQKPNSESETDDKPTFDVDFNAKNSSPSTKIDKNSESESEMRPSFGFGFNTTETSSKKSTIKKDTSESENNLKKSKNKISFVSYISENPSSKRAAETIEDTVFSPKKKSKKEKCKPAESVGISNPAFNPMATPLKIQKHSLNTIEESLTEEMDESISSQNSERKQKINLTAELEENVDGSKESPKKKKKTKNEDSNQFSNPIFSEDLEESAEISIEKNPYEVFTNKLKSKKKTKNIEEIEVSTSKKVKKSKSVKLEVDNPNFDDTEKVSINSSQIEENPYEVKLKKKNKKSKKLEVHNPNFDDTEETSINISQEDENPYEVKPSEKKKKKKDKKLALDNPGFEDHSEKPVDSINPYEVKPKSKRKKNTEDSGIANPALDLNTSKNEETTIIEDFDLMLNVVSTPIPKEERHLNLAGSVSKVESVNRRKSVRFNNITQELIIPNNEELKEMYKKKDKSKRKNNKGVDNVNFDKQKTNLDENVDTMAKTLDNYQAEIENDINEDKIKSVTVEDLMVGEVGNPHGENEKLKDGTKLKFKYAHFDSTRTPFYMLDKVGARKSYKHLIKGDILLKFKNTNLHEIKGYATKNVNTV